MTKSALFDASCGLVPSRINLKRHEDNRGFFCELWKSSGFDLTVAQCNFSSSSYGTVRGLHWQVPPFEIHKYVVCLDGIIQDVAVDLRKSSSTFGKAHLFLLEECEGLFVPAGFAHGFMVISKTAKVLYLQNKEYAQAAERSLYFADPELQIPWNSKVQFHKLSLKDSKAPLFKDLTNADLFP